MLALGGSGGLLLPVEALLAGGMVAGSAALLQQHRQYINAMWEPLDLRFTGRIMANCNRPQHDQQ